MSKRSSMRVFAALAAAGAFALATPVARAEEPSLEERVDALEKKIGFDFTGTLYGSYQYNFNDPETDTNTLRSLDPEENNFTFDLFQLGIKKDVIEGLTFVSKLDFGKTASRVVSDWNGDGALDNSEETNDFEAQDVFLTYAPEALGGVTFKAGKFATLLGAEVIEATANPNFSRSFLFGYAIPFTHTGLLTTVPIGEAASITAGVVNGWDNVVDNNDGKTFLGNVAITPSPAFSFYVNGVFGPEKTDTNDDPRGVVDVVGTMNFDPATISLNFDYGAEGGADPDGGDATWVGFAGIFGLALEEMTGVPAGVYLRGEVFDDQDGARTGTEQQLWEFTLTGKYFLTENLTAWAEFRHDGSNEDTFADEGAILLPDDTILVNTTDSQDTILIALSLVF